MADYIDREVAIGALKTLQKELKRDFPLSEKDPEDASFNYGLWQGVTWAIRGIKEVHQADVKPVMRCAECNYWNAETHGCTRNPSLAPWWETDYCCYWEQKCSVDAR